MTRGLAVELGPHGVRVNALAPGIVATPLTKPITGNPVWNDAYARHAALGRWAEPEEMAGPVVFLASDASSYLTATTIFADAGWTAIDGRFEPTLAPTGRSSKQRPGQSMMIAQALAPGAKPESLTTFSPRA